MMAFLYLFNPENDLALAQGCENYTPPPLVQAIVHDLSPLPLWYASTGGVTCLSSADYADSLLPLLAAVGAEGRVCPTDALPTEVSACRPWGWSPDVVHRFKRWGVAPELLPSADLLERQRAWAHRVRTREVLSFLKEEGIDVPDEMPIAFQEESAVRSWVEAQPRAMLKAPWSGSGRGICRTFGYYDLYLSRWVQGILRQQGTVIGEPYFEKVADMAMEFFSDGSRVTFAGYSWFTTDERCQYQGNALLSDRAIEQRFAAYCPLDTLHRVRSSLERFFTCSVAPLYSGYFGVDMLIYRRADGFALHPCIEINLRMNMGMVARIFYDRYVSSESEGIYRVDYFPQTDSLSADHSARQAANPLCISGGKIVSGYMSLTPILPTTRYRAYVEVHPK
ncbi:MAG: hypothetical protein LUI04_07055 [Porphyromonadaceae bacterium]|nr:hypothetical protein [Porphyromonadaceae bacterium]